MREQGNEGYKENMPLIQVRKKDKQKEKPLKGNLKKELFFKNIDLKITQKSKGFIVMSN